jgi:hypothetical protein
VFFSFILLRLAADVERKKKKESYIFGELDRCRSQSVFTTLRAISNRLCDYLSFKKEKKRILLLLLGALGW